MNTTYRFFLLPVVAAACLAVLSGCSNDVTEPGWNKPSPTLAPAVISSLVPADSAAPGVTKITIDGTNFSPETDGNLVFFGTTQAEVISQSANQIVVYRPNLVTDSCMLTIAPRSTDKAAYFTPYKITSVVTNYCTLPSVAAKDNLPLNAVVVDNAENVYLARASKGIFRVGATGQIDSLLKSFAVLTDAIIGLDNKLYMLSNATQIRSIALTSGATYSTWVTATKAVKYGDFDANGYFYGGTINNLFTIISPAKIVKTDTTYLTSTILAVRVCSSYVYVAAKIGTSTKIFRHSVSVAGTLGTQQLFYDWSASPYASSNVTSLAFANDGTMYVGTDASSNSIVSITPLGTADYLYKGILPGYCALLSWGSGNYLYMVTGNTSGIDWVTYRIAMGTTKATR